MKQKTTTSAGDSRKTPKNPLKVAAGKRRRPWTAEQRERLRRQCLSRKPWLKSTGPRTDAGKRRTAENGRLVLPNPHSTRSLRREMAGVLAFAREIQALRQALSGTGMATKL